MKINHAQRVGIFVDVQNMYYSAKNLYSKKVNFEKIMELGVGERQLIRAIAYVIRADIEPESNFFEMTARTFDMGKISLERVLFQ